VIPGVAIVAIGPSGQRQATSGNDGSYVLTGLAPGAYEIQATAPGLSQGQPAPVTISNGTTTLNIQMRLVVERQEITVSDTTAPEVSIDPTQTASAQVMRNDDLEALSDDADDLITDLQMLAGPAAGLNGAQIFIDGFTAGDGTLPSKDAIREVRINQNPFAPEFDTMGTGHVEILTKPGSDQLHGQVYFSLRRRRFQLAKSLRRPEGSLQHEGFRRQPQRTIQFQGIVLPRLRPARHR
jgi:hypothetical protein